MSTVAQRVARGEYDASLSAAGPQLLKRRHPRLAASQTLLIELGGRAHAFLMTEIPPQVARDIAAGDRRAAAEGLAHLHNRNDISNLQARCAALPLIALHLPPEDRDLHYDDLRVRLAEYDTAYAGDSEQAQDDAWARVDTALTNLTGVDQ